MSSIYWQAEPGKQPHCNICGRFAYALRDPDGHIVRNKDGSVAVWRFRCVTWDDYMGAWEHE